MVAEKIEKKTLGGYFILPHPVQMPMTTNFGHDLNSMTF